MQWKAAGAVAVLGAALACSACGGSEAVRRSQPPTVTTTHAAKVVPLPTLPPAANIVIVPLQHGVGNARLGSFTASGSVYVEASCSGKGFLTIVSVSKSGPCDGEPVGVEVPQEEGKRLNLAVRANPGTTWRLTVGENVPGAALSLVHSSGFGSRSFGVFAVHGPLHYKTACRGPGTLLVAFTSLETDTGRDDEGNCVGLAYSTEGGVDVQGGRVRISVDAPRRTHWTLSVSER